MLFFFVEQILKERIARLEATNEDLCRELHEYRSRRAVVGHYETDAQVCQWKLNPIHCFFSLFYLKKKNPPLAWI